MKIHKLSRSEAGKLGAIANKNIHNWLKKQERIVTYYETANRCKWCGKPIPYNKRDQKSFCCYYCKNTYITVFGHKYNCNIEKEKLPIIQLDKTCLYCGKNFRYKPSSKNKFCSLECSAKYRLKPLYTKIENNEQVSTISLRNYLLKKHNKCMNPQCGWNWEINFNGRTVPLELHHIDGDASNNKLSNVVLLCPNCHSLTENYKARNKGKGRLSRVKLYVPKGIVDKYILKK